jgi:tetratricopeptide (TPR) repeat protein
MRRLSYNAVCSLVLTCLAAGYLISFFYVRRFRPRELKTEFSAANALYESGDYRAAIDAYENLAARYNIQCMSLYYNLAGAYLRTNDLGRAILYYSKAQRLAPRDSDVAANLRIARARANLTDIPENDPSPRSFGRRFVKLLPISLFEGVAASLMFRWSLVVSVVLTVFFGRKRRYLVRISIVLAVLFYLSLIATVCQAYLQKSDKQAVVLDPDSSVSDKPGRSNPDIGILKLGTTVRVKSRRGPWIQIVLHDGRIGWIRENAVGEI